MVSALRGLRSTLFLTVLCSLQDLKFPNQGMNPCMPLAMAVRSPNSWTAWELPTLFFNIYSIQERILVSSVYCMGLASFLYSVLSFFDFLRSSLVVIFKL